jgi:2-dehydro-3-deoxy-D-arabinonate dehydratase
MRLGQIRSNGAIVAAVFEEDGAHQIPAHTLYDLIKRAGDESVPLNELAHSLASRVADGSPAILPIHPPEVWACGCTYETSATFRDGEHGTREGMYAHVYREARPEIFFKGTARVCVGPYKGIGMRSDSKFTAPEPELGVMLGKGGTILGYTLANDVSAWDIERENALYLPQSKVYNCCCALGPVIVTPDELKDPYNITITCTIQRNGGKLFEGCVSTSKLHRKVETLVEYLYRSNNVPTGSVMLTGTGIIVKEDAALAPGDTVSISAPEIGTLTNTVVVV